MADATMTQATTPEIAQEALQALRRMVEQVSLWEENTTTCAFCGNHITKHFRTCPVRKAREVLARAGEGA